MTNASERAGKTLDIGDALTASEQEGKKFDIGDLTGAFEWAGKKSEMGEATTPSEAKPKRNCDVVSSSLSGVLSYCADDSGSWSCFAILCQRCLPLLETLICETPSTRSSLCVSSKVQLAANLIKSNVHLTPMKFPVP